MKSLIFFIAFSLLSSFSYAQVVVGDVDINAADSVNVIEVFIDRRMSRKSVDVYVDFGQKDNSNALTIVGNSDNLMITLPGTKKKMVFKSTAAVINFLENNNWEHYNNLSVDTGNFAGFYYYFRKKTTK